MNVQQLRVFVEVCGSETLQEAAEKLGLKQPTVSFHLRKLEEELGVKLFHKPARSLFPTENAADLLPYARRIVALMEDVEAMMEERREQGEGKLKLGASYTPATYFLPPHMAAFGNLHPRVRIQLSVKKADSLLDMLRKYEIDAAVVSLPSDRLEGLVMEKLMEDELKLLLSPAHPLAQCEMMTAANLQPQTFLLHEAGSTSRKLTDEWAAAIGLRWQSFMELGAIETIKEAVKCNIGIGVLPKRSVIREATSGELIMRDLPQHENRRHICLVYRREEQIARQVRAFIAFLLHECAEEPLA
ncbi:LysR family transcriptional regulator [Paenibacillus rhizovicinus]|uniref:LysR family transcriptional regulator n=1 Tax=Paenibacillus rhizovicinus TaxID=2704463 RepID=A0A6C0P215_9BACL|nr:LysR family transcriptional regulator [Paenibacillus rhizovicinus]QHW32509.1 LysR family transcriptional regulator [Paenibacillus rhizovicinus]